jgi:hypothetical protein
VKAFLAWKRANGEDVSAEAPVFNGQRGPLTRNGVWRVVKGPMAAVGLDPRYATHSCRHYAGFRTMPGEGRRELPSARESRMPPISVSTVARHRLVVITAG